MAAISVSSKWLAAPSSSCRRRERDNLRNSRVRSILLAAASTAFEHMPTPSLTDLTTVREIRAAGPGADADSLRGAYLELFVKVDKDWQRHPKSLERLGY